jgi:hypothetical protein
MDQTKAKLTGKTNCKDPITPRKKVSIIVRFHVKNPKTVQGLHFMKV